MRFIPSEPQGVESLSSGASSGLSNEADINKATGLDEIPAKLLKWAAALFASMLTKLFNKCIEEGVYPDSLKVKSQVKIGFIMQVNK